MPRARPSTGSLSPRFTNRRLEGQSGVGSLEVQALFEANPSWRRLPLHSYPWVDRCPEHLVAAAAAAAREPFMLPPLGFEPLRERLARDFSAETGASVTASAIAVTNGAQAALQTIWLALLSPGDAVLVPAPNYYVEGAIRMAGGEFQPLPAVSTDAMDWERIADAIGPTTRALFLTNPNNPMGYLLKPHDFDALDDLLAAYPQLWIVADESYEGIRHDGRPHLALWTRPGLRERSITVRSFSKSYAVSWLRVGWLAAPDSLMPALHTIVEWQQLYGSCLNQSVALAVLDGDRSWLTPAFRGFTEGRDRLYAAFASIEGCRVGLPEAGPFLFPDIGNVKRGYDTAIARLRRGGIAAVEARYFGVERKAFRMPFGGNNETLSEAASVIAAALGG